MCQAVRVATKVESYDRRGYAEKVVSEQGTVL